MKKLFVLILCLFPMLVKANISADYIINNIKINKIDKDATTARQKAIYEGQRGAFNILLSRLAIDDSNGIIITDEEISQMIRSMQIKNERITNNSYSSTLTMEFSPEYVKYILNKYKISKFSPKINSYLIIPILKENNQTYLWEKNNKWMNLFKKNIKNNKNIFLVEPEYQTKDLIDLDGFEKINFSKFKKLAELYNVNNVVLVIGNYKKNTEIIYTKIYILNSDKSKVATMDYEVENLNNINLDFNNASIKIIDYIDNLDQKENNDTSKNLNLSNGKIYIFVPISSLQEYNNTNNILNANKNITAIDLKMLSKNLVVYSASFYNNDIKLLINSLKKDGFSVSEKKNGLYLFL